LMSYTRSEFPADLLAGEPTVERSAPRKRGSLSRVLITFCAGVAATLGWQSYGDATREIIASSYPQFGWLAPQAAVAQAVPNTVGAATSSPDRQELKTMSLELAGVRQRLDQLATSQQQMTRDFTTKLRAAEQDILDKISVPPQQQPAAPARKPVSPPLQVAPGR
jgi:hypothetical protein